MLLSFTLHLWTTFTLNVFANKTKNAQVAEGTANNCIPGLVKNTHKKKRRLQPYARTKVDPTVHFEISYS